MRAATALLCERIRARRASIALSELLNCTMHRPPRCLRRTEKGASGCSVPWSTEVMAAAPRADCMEQLANVKRHPPYQLNVAEPTPASPAPGPAAPAAALPGPRCVGHFRGRRASGEGRCRGPGSRAADRSQPDGDGYRSESAPPCYGELPLTTSWLRPTGWAGPPSPIGWPSAQ
jgi:hypothetical protein